MRGRWIPVTAAVAALVLAGGTTACGGDGEGSDDGGGADQIVKVGGIFDLSGDTADVGTPYANGIKGFVKYWNEHGRGPKINLTSEDYKYDSKIAKRLYDGLKNEGVVALQGWGTGATEALRRRVTAHRVPFMSGSLAETLTKPSQTPFNFVAAMSYSDQMRIAMRWISEQASGTEVAFLHHNSDFGESPLKAGAQAAEQLDLGFKAYAMPENATDYVPQLRQARSQGATFVVIQNV
ncbi:MAG: ABC transporter substrate-binding protein, partial [Solirubrobacteraceae bacterium]